MFNTNCYGNESIPSYTQGVETPWPSHATHSNQNIFHQHGVASNPNAFVGYGLGQVQSKELDLAGVVGMKDTSGSTSTPSATTNAWHHSHHRMRYSSTAAATRGFLPYQMSSLPHYDSQSVDTSHHQFWMTNSNAYSLMQNFNQRDHNTYAERTDTSRTTGAIRHNTTMPNRTYAVEDQSRNVNVTLQQQPAEVLSQHCQRPSRQPIHQLQQHQQIHHQQEYLRNTLTQRERDPCQYTNSSYHQESMRVGVDSSLYHDQHVMPSTQHQHPQYQPSQEALRKAETERRAAFTSRQTWPQTWAKAPAYVPFDTSQAFLSNHRSSGSAFQPCNKQAGTDPYSMDSIWAKSAVPTPSTHVPHATNHTIPPTNNHVPLPAQSWIHDTSHLKSNVYRPPQEMNQVTNVPSNFSTNVLNLDTGQVELSMSVVPPDLSLYSQAVPQMQRQRTTTAHPASMPVQPRHRPLPTPAVPQNHVKPVLKEAPSKAMESSKPTSTARAAGLDVRQFLATWDEDLDIATPRPAIIETDEPEPPEPAATSLVVLDYQTVPSEEAAGLLQMYPGLQLSGNDSVVLLDDTPTKTNLDFVLSRAVPTTSSEVVSALANEVQVSQSSSAIVVAHSPALGTTPAASTSDPGKLLDSNHIEANPCNANKSTNVGEIQVDLSSQPRSQEALTPLSVCESDSEKQKKTSLRLFRKRKAVSAESDTSSQCSEHTDEVSTKCMKSDNSLSNWFGNDSMDTIDGPIRTPVSVSSAAYDPSSSAAQSPVGSMGVIEEKSAEDSAVPESTAVSVITMNRGAKDLIGRSMPDIFDEVMYEVNQAPSKSVETERRDTSDDPGLFGKADVVSNIVASQFTDERNRQSHEQSGKNAVDMDRTPCNNMYQHLSDGIKKSSPEIQAKSPVAEFESKEIQQPSEISQEKHNNSSQIPNKTDLETIFSDQEFSRNTDHESSEKFELDSGNKCARKTFEEPEYSDEVPSIQLKPSNNSDRESTVTTDLDRHNTVDNGVTHRSPIEFGNQKPPGFMNRELYDLTNLEHSTITTTQTSDNPNEGVWDITTGEPCHNRGEPFHISYPEEKTNKQEGDSINNVIGDSTNENSVDFSNRDPSDLVNHVPVDFALRNSSDISSQKCSDFSRQSPLDFTIREPSDVTIREPSDFAGWEPSVIASREPSVIAIREPCDIASREPSVIASREPCDIAIREHSDITSRQPSDITSRELSDITTREPSDITSREPSDITSREPSDITGREPSDITGREPSDITGRESSDITSHVPSDVTSREPSDNTPQEPNGHTSREPCHITSPTSSNIWREERSSIASVESCDMSRKPSDFPSQEPREFTDREQCDFTDREQCDFTDREQCDFTSVEPCDFTSREPSDITSREPSDITSREPSDVTSREPSDVTSREPSDVTSREPSDITSREPSDFTGPEPSDITSRESSDITSHVPSDVTSREPSDVTSREPSDITSREPSDITSREPSDITGREPSDITGRESSDITSHVPSDVTSREPSDNTPQEPNGHTSREPCHITSPTSSNMWREERSSIASVESCDMSRKPSDFPSQKPREFTDREQCDFTSLEPCDFTSREPRDVLDLVPTIFNKYAPTNLGNRALTDEENQEPSGSRYLESIKSRSPEPSKPDHLESIESSSVVSPDSFKAWKAIDSDAHEPSDRVNREPNDAVNLEHGNLINQEHSDSVGKIGIDNSVASSADISVDPYGAELCSITAQEVQNLAPNANVEPCDEPPPSTSAITMSEKVESENEVIPVCRYASSKLSSEGSQNTTQYLSRIVGSAPGKIPKILLSRLKNVRDKKRRNGVVQKLPCIRLTRVQTGTSMSVHEHPEYVCREGDSRSEDVDGRKSVSDSPNHELRVNKVQKTDRPVGQCFDSEVESPCRDESRTGCKSKSDSPNSFESGESRETAARRSEDLPSPEELSPLERLDAGKDVQKTIRDDDGILSHCNAQRSGDGTSAFTYSSEPNCVDLTVSQAYELSCEYAISRPPTPVSPFEKKMSSGQMFRNKSPDVAERLNQDFPRRRPEPRRYAPKRRFSLPSPKSFEEDATFDSPVQIKNYQSESKVLTSAFKYTLVPVRMRSVSADEVESKINEMLLETKEDADRGNEKEFRREQENTEKMSSSWEEDSCDMIVPELSKNLLEVRKEAQKIDSVYKSPVRSSSNELKISVLEKELARRNSDSSSVRSFRRNRKDSPAGFDSPWKDNSRERDSSSSEEDDSTDSSDTSSASSSKTSRRSSSSESDSSDSDASSDESWDDEKDIARAEKEDISSPEKEYVARAGKEDTASAKEYDTASAKEEDTTSAKEEDTTSAKEEDTTSAKEEDTASAREKDFTSAGREDSENHKIYDSISPAADELFLHEAEVKDTFAPENEVQVEGGRLPDPLCGDVGISPCVQNSEIVDAHADDFNGERILQKTEHLLTSPFSSSHAIEPQVKTNAEEHDKSDIPEVCDSSNGHVRVDDVSKELLAAQNASLVSVTCQDGAIVDYTSKEDDTCPALEPIDPEQPLPISESTEMPCLEKIVEPEGTSNGSLKNDLPKILNRINEIGGTDVLDDQDTLLVFTDDVDSVFVEEDGCVQVEVQGENSEFHAPVRDESAREFNVVLQDENAGGFSVEVHDEDAGEFPVGVHDEKTEEFHIVVDEEQYHGLCNGTMEVFTSDSMKTFTVENIQEEFRDCEEVVPEAEHPDQGDFYCDEIGSAPVEEVVNSEATCDIEGDKVYGSWREEGVDIHAPLECVDNESFVNEGTLEEETGYCNKIPLEMKCSLSWDRILNEGQGLVLGPANVEVRVPGESAKETTHWKVVTRERKRPGTSKTSSCVEENNNVMVDVKSPIIVVKRLVLKRPRARRSQRKREEDTLGDLRKDAAKILPPLKTKGALKAFQAQTEGTHVRNRNRSWPDDSGDTTWKRRSLKRRRSDLSPPARTYSCSSPQRLPKVIIKKTGPQYQSFICGDDVFMQPVVSIERNAELDNLALTMWSEGSSPMSVGLSPQHDSSDQTKDMGVNNVNQVHRGKRKQPKAGRAGQLMKVVELLQQWRQAEQEAASKVSQDSLQSDCDDSIENNNSLMCIDNNADVDRYLHRYHSSDSSSNSSQGGSITNDFSYTGNAAEEETNLRRDSDDEDLRAYVHDLIESVGQEDEVEDNTADRKELEDNLEHIEDNSGQCDAQEDNGVESTLQEDDTSEKGGLKHSVSEKDYLEENVVQESVLQDNIVEDTVLEDSIVEENVLENNTVEENLLEDNLVKGVRGDNIVEEDVLEDVQDLVQVKNTNQQDVQEKQMLDVIAQTDDITEDSILNDNIVEEVVEDESVTQEVLLENAPDEGVVKEVMSQDGLVEKIVEDIVQEYDNIGRFGISTLQEADSVLQDKTIQEADSAFEAASGQETASVLQEEVVVREADSVLQEDVYLHDLQQGVDISCTQKDIEGNTLSPEQSRRTSIEEELGLPLVCQVCGFTTTRLEEQANHIRTHSYHCQRCQLAFLSQEDFKDHLAAEHPTIEELHHCLLCQRTFPTAERHAQHKKGWHHNQMERSQRHTIHSLYRFFTGNDCPYLPSLAPEELKAFEWLPSDPGVIHFYHDATPLQLAVQDCGGAKDDTETC